MRIKKNNIPFYTYWFTIFLSEIFRSTDFNVSMFNKFLYSRIYEQENLTNAQIGDCNFQYSSCSTSSEIISVSKSNPNIYPVIVLSASFQSTLYHLLCVLCGGRKIYG